MITTFGNNQRSLEETSIPEEQPVSNDRMETKQERRAHADLSRREFLRRVPLSAAFVWGGAAGFASLATSLVLPREAWAQSGAPLTRPFLMVTMGDSLMWGQGLPENMKFRNIVASWIQGQLGGRLVRQFNRAHSGADIAISGPRDYAPNLSGEIPSGYPSVGMQVRLAAGDVLGSGFALDDVDLVLLNGGINDVGILSILLPTNSSGKVEQMATNTCVARMRDLLLPSVKATFRNAAVVIVGYPLIASQNSDIYALTALFSAVGASAGIAVAGYLGGAAGAVLGPATRDQMVANSVAWKNTTDSGFAQLASPAGQQPRVAFASPVFAPENCFAAGPASFLFSVAVAPTVSASAVNGFYGDESMGIAGVYEPADPLHDVQWKRARACVAAGRTDPLCPDACMGHPNQLGAQAYAGAILREIETTLAPYLATRGLVENPACAPLRARENVATGTVRGVQDQLGQMGNEQRDCQAGIGPEGGRQESYKPKQCGALEIEAEKKKLNATREQAISQLTVIRSQKVQAGCWF